ncbi:MAG: S49 family peptidase [Nitrosomonas sp.]|nr:S49 family peptidase [Nitrosomonas sp.]
MNEPESKNKQENWERSLLENLALASLREQRRTRSWGIFFKILAALYLFILLFAALGWIEEGSVRLPEKHTALIEVKGVIAADTMSSAEKIVSSLQAAFKDKNTKGVVLRINSPGGSPVQAGHINDEIHRLRLKYPQIPVYAVVSDICASGGYYVAVAADKIFVDKASLVGSIGVLMDGFGFAGTLEKLGVERRLLTAGENKGFLDPFTPLDPAQKKYAESLLKEIHEQFIQVVKQGRGERLKNDPAIFSGIVWTGEKSIELGITDAIGSAEYVAREIIQAETLVDYTPHEGFSDLFRRQRLGQVLMDFLPKSEWVIK